MVMPMTRVIKPRPLSTVCRIFSGSRLPSSTPMIPPTTRPPTIGEAWDLDQSDRIRRVHDREERERAQIPVRGPVSQDRESVPSLWEER